MLYQWRTNMKYIDTDKLITALERQNVDKKVIEPVIRIINSLQQEQPEVLIKWLTKQFNLAQKCMKSAERDWERAYENGQMEAYGNVLSLIGGSPYEPSKQEQPDVDFAKAIKEEMPPMTDDEDLGLCICDHWGNHRVTVKDIYEIARHFIEVGLNARKED